MSTLALSSVRTATPVPMKPAPAQPARGGRPASPASPLPPLQKRSPEQLKDGLVVEVSGAGSDDIAVARLIQDGAQFVARQAGTTMGLKKVTINDRGADAAGALGWANFQGLDGWFGLSQRSTKGLMDGINKLRTQPFAEWNERERASFLQANATVLHEAAHVTLPAYDRENVGAFRTADRQFEEGLTEITTMHQIAPFMKEEYDVDVPAESFKIQAAVSAYTRFTERIERALEMGSDGTTDTVGRLAAQIGDNVKADQRINVIAERISANLGGPNAPDVITKEIAKTLPEFVAEKNGTRTRMMELMSALADHKAGRPVDTNQLMLRLAQIDIEAAGNPAAPRTPQPRPHA